MLKQLNSGQADRMAKRYELYQAGLNDRAISREQGVDRTAVRDWRRRNGLPVNSKLDVPPKAVLVDATVSVRPRRVRDQVTPEQARLRQERYDAGDSDPAIAKVSGISANSILDWRQRNSLPSNLPKCRSRRCAASLAVVTPELKRRAKALLERGVGARTIAREMSASLKSIERWRTAMLRERPELRRTGTAQRKPPRHPNGRKYSKMQPERRAKAFGLYADGFDDHEIAKALGVYSTQIWEWRHALFLPLVPKTRHKHAGRPKPKPPGPAISPMSNPIYAHIAAAIGRGIAPDLVDDAVSDMWLALAEGRLSPQQISAEASKFRNRVIGSYASAFGPRSLHEDIGDGDGFRMLDLLKDHSSSDWLEEMGATVW